MSPRVIGAPAGTASLVGDAAMLSAVTVVVGPLSLVIGPAAAWYLHGRRFDRLALVAGTAGLAVGLVSVGCIYLLLVGAIRLIEPLGGSEFTGGIILLAVAGIALLSTLVALDVHAITDLASSRRHHVRLDIVRLVSTLVIFLIGAVSVIQMTVPGSEVGDIGPFALLSAAVAAATTFAGDRLYSRWLGRAAADPAAMGGPPA